MRWHSVRSVRGVVAAAVVIVVGVAGLSCNAVLGIDDIDANGCLAPGARQCADRQPQKCGSNGRWQDDGAACPYRCSEGQCAACEPGLIRCEGNDTPQICDENEQWKNEPVCAAEEHCEGGKCACTPGTTRCMGNMVQTCGASGGWKGGADCDSKTCCNGSCVNTAIDPANCSMCSITCDAAVGEICQTGGAPGPTCANVDWARWPMPNGAVDVAAGAPNLAGYIDNGNGTVTDMVTGLMWQQTVDPGSYTWINAKTYCSITLSNLALGGHHDWRLPSYMELVTLVDYSIPSPGPTINTVFFPNTPSGAFWSATPSAGSPSNAWYVPFSFGYTSYDGVTNTYRVRCVR